MIYWLLFERVEADVDEGAVSGHLSPSTEHFPPAGKYHPWRLIPVSVRLSKLCKPPRRFASYRLDVDGVLAGRRG